jgi:hypothetical protein
MHATYANSMNSSDTRHNKAAFRYVAQSLLGVLCCCRTNTSYLLEQECPNFPCSSFISLLKHYKDNNGPNKLWYSLWYLTRKPFFMGRSSEPTTPVSITTQKHHEDTVTSKRFQAQHLPYPDITLRLHSYHPSIQFTPQNMYTTKKIQQ